MYALHRFFRFRKVNLTNNIKEWSGSGEISVLSPSQNSCIKVVSSGIVEKMECVENFWPFASKTDYLDLPNWVF